MPETADVRRRLRQTIEQARRRARERRLRVDAATEDGRRVLGLVVAKVARSLAGALRAEGRPFRVETPAGAVRLSPEGSAERFVEMVLETTQTPPVLLLRVSQVRGRRVLMDETVVRTDPEIGTLTEDEALDLLLTGLEPFFE